MLNANTEIRPVEQPDFGVLADFELQSSRRLRLCDVCKGYQSPCQTIVSEEQEATIHKYDT